MKGWAVAKSTLEKLVQMACAQPPVDWCGYVEKRLGPRAVGCGRRVSDQVPAQNREKPRYLGSLTLGGSFHIFGETRPKVPIRQFRFGEVREGRGGSLGLVSWSAGAASAISNKGPRG